MDSALHSVGRFQIANLYQPGTDALLLARGTREIMDAELCRRSGVAIGK